MNRSENSGSVKRKRPESNSVDDSFTQDDRVVLNAIKDKKDMGIWIRDLKREAKLPDNTVTKSVKLLLFKKLIKEVANIQYKGKKHYMAVEFEPSKEISGGVWYSDGIIDKPLVENLKNVVSRLVYSKKVVTVDGVCEFFNKKKVTHFECSNQQVGEILNSMVLGNEIMEVKSSGLGEYNDIPPGSLCYRALSSDALAKGPKIGAMGSIPCGMCPRISQCTPDGVISPATCVYFKKWLDF